MQHNSIAEFFAMGGYGFYVWLAFGISFLAMAILVMTTHFKKKELIKVVHREYQRKERIKAAQTQKL